jgi:glucose-1-phosphate cytidylyltransferase
VKVVILCGGQGTRLREETEFRPKPLVEIGGRPILWHIMKIYAHHGFSDFVLCLGYRGSMIKEHFLNYEAMNHDLTIRLGPPAAIEYHDATVGDPFTVTLADTGLETQTGARLTRIRRYLDQGPFMVTYGDGVADVDVRALLDFHRSHGKIATVTAVRPTARFGIPDVGQDGTVTRFAEKPVMEGWVSAGFFVFNQELFDYVSPDPGCALEREPLSRLAADGQLAAYRHPGFFHAMDTYREVIALNEQWDQGAARWKVWR